MAFYVVMFIIISAVISFPIIFLIHELGHLICGLITGYRLIYFEILGIGLYFGNKKKKIMRRRNMPPGQCLMYPLNINNRPYLMIVGGSVLNIAVGTVFLIISMSCGLYFFILFFMLGTLSIILGLSNLFGKSPTCDGRAFFECVRDVRDMAAFNNIMLIAKDIENGIAIKDMPDRYFVICGNVNNSSIAAEINEYAVMHKN